MILTCECTCFFGFSFGGVFLVSYEAHDGWRKYAHELVMILVGYMTITWVITGGENGQNKFSALLVICGIICSLVKWVMQHEIFIQ